MKKLVTNRRLLLGSVGLIWVILCIAAQLASIRRTYILAPSKIRHEIGFAYEAPINSRPLGWPITTYEGDTLKSPYVSRLDLYEDGKPIGPAHTLHDDIRKQGLGRYSHWGGWVIFSASDNSNPLKNGRTYAVSIPATLSDFGDFTIVLALLAVLWAFRLVGLCRKALDGLCSPWDPTSHKIVGMGLFLSLIIFAVAYLLFLWKSSVSIDDAIASYFQFSDAGGYWNCANTLLGDGKLTEWCTRRPIYPSFLAGINLLGARYVFCTLLLQACIASVALFVFARRVSIQFSVTAAVACAAALLVYDTHYLMMLTMTENAGVIFGCVGFALLLKAAENRSLSWIMAGMVVVSIALCARAGAFFVLPCLVMWAGVMALLSRQSVWRWAIAACVTGLAGFILSAALVLASGRIPADVFGNFSYTLYGLAVGGKGWGQTLIDHPELIRLPDVVMSRKVYELAWKAFMAHPMLFVHGLEKNFSLFMTSGTYGYEILGSWALYAKILWWLAWIPLLKNFRNPTYLLVGLSSIGIAASAPLLLMDGGPRIFAATIPIDTLQIGIGLHFVGQFILQVANIALGHSVSQNSVGTSPHEGWIRKHLEPVVASSLLAMVIIPYTPLRHVKTQGPVTPEPTASYTCAAGEDTIVAQIGPGGSQLLDIMPGDGQYNFWHGEISRHRFVKGIPPGTWWGGAITAFGHGSLLQAYQLNGQFQGDVYEVYSTEHLSKYWGRTVQLCVDKANQKKLLNLPFGKLDSLKVLD